MSQRGHARHWLVPTVWALLITTLLGVALSTSSWAFVDVYNNFYNATAFSWSETIGNAFTGSLEYRPLLIISMKLAHQLVGLRAWAYQTLVLLQFAAILGALIYLFRPSTRPRAVAACIALACVAGLHSSRVLFMVAPLNAHSFGVVLLLAGVILAMSPRSPAAEWGFAALTLVALLLLESGALIVAIALVLWRIGAPGATGRLVTGSLVAAALYAAVRLGAGAPAGAATYTETGLGFADVSAAQLGETFTHAPWMLWLYNYIASLLTVLVSEPRAGRYLFIESLLHGNTPAWMYVHVLTSVVTTGAIAYMLASGRVVHDRDRQIAAAGLTILILGSVLGFLYTRDRIALSAGVGYAMLVYVAVAAMWEEGRKWPSITALCIGVIAVGWATRAGEAYFQLRDAAWENYLEWTLRYEELGGHTRPQTDVLTTLRRDATARVPDDPRRDAAWTYAVFERQYQRTATR